MINVREKFLQLTNNRTPKGLEESVIKLITEFTLQKDEFDNYYYIIKKSDGTFSNTMFSAHLDTIDRGPSSYSVGHYDNELKKWIYPEKNEEEKEKDKEKLIKHVFDGDFVKTDGNTNLGADDKAGVTIMINLMSEGVPGLYYFFMGEESGCVGSSSLSRVYKSKVESGVLPQVNKCIAFDRRGYDSIITEQMSSECCSDVFAKDLAAKLNEYGFWFKPDPTGIYTDSAEFTDVISECTNLSVGYFSEHTTSEKQDLEFLELFAITLTKIDWEKLQVFRDTSKIIYKGKKSATYNRGGANWDWDDDYSEFWYGNTNHNFNNFNTSTKNNNTYVDRGKGDLDKLNNTINDDAEFDKWYLEQKNKGWKIDDTLKNNENIVD